MRHVYRHLMLAGLLGMLLCLGGAALAQDTGQVRIDVYAVDDTYYPEMRITFSAYTASGRAVENLTSDVLRATHNGQPIQVERLEEVSGAGRPVHVAICFDLTSSVSGDYLDEQKLAAQLLIDELGVNDQVAVITFDNDGARVVQPLTIDKNAALNEIDVLSIVQGDFNKFRDGVYTAVEALQANPDPAARRAVVILTDVIEPRGDRTIEETTALANTLNAPVHLIGFGDSTEDILGAYAAPTRGFVYLERELDDGLGRLAQDMAVVLSQEYTVNLRSNQPANNDSSTVALTIDLSGGAGGTVDTTVTTRQRGIQINFRLLENNGPVSGDVTFEPEIVYADNNLPVPIAAIAYYIERPNGSLELLNPPDSSEPVFMWETEEVAGGVYTILAQVTDTVGNAGEGRVNVQIASPLRVYFIDPPFDPAADSGEVQLGPGTITVMVGVESSYAVNEVRLFVDDQQIGAPLTEAPYQFTWDTGSMTAAGLYSLRAEATDVNGATAQAPLAARVPIDNGLALIILLGLGMLVVLVGTALAVNRLRGQQANAAVAGAAAGPAAQAANAYLRAVRPSSYNNYAFALNANGITTVGRSSVNDIQVFGQSASRDHARVIGDGGAYIYRDLKAENPSYVNGQPLHGDHYLQEGDRIVISETELVFTRQP